MKSKKIIKKMFSSKKNRKITLKKTKQQQQKKNDWNNITSKIVCITFEQKGYLNSCLMVGSIWIFRTWYKLPLAYLVLVTWLGLIT